MSRASHIAKFRACAKKAKGSGKAFRGKMKACLRK